MRSIIVAMDALDITPCHIIDIIYICNQCAQASPHAHSLAHGLEGRVPVQQGGPGLLHSERAAAGLNHKQQAAHLPNHLIGIDHCGKLCVAQRRPEAPTATPLAYCNPCGANNAKVNQKCTFP